MRIPILASVALTLGACASTPAVQPAPATPMTTPTQATVVATTRKGLPADSFEIARKYTQWFYAGQTDSLVAHHVAELQQKPNLAGEIQKSREQLTSHVGHELQVLDEKFITRNGQRQYWRTAKFSLYNDPILFRWVITPQGQISGVGMGPLSSAPPIDPQP